MGKKSIKENKNIYQLSRESLGLTREAAAELMEWISADKIEKIESEKTDPRPEEILRMCEVYKNPVLRNYYCTHECPIGIKHVPKLKVKDLSQIVLEIVSNLNDMEKEKNRLISITVDGQITEDEYKDFATIDEQLDNIAKSVRTLRLWLEQQIADGNIDAEKLNTYRIQNNK